MKGRNKVSVVLPTYNEKDTIIEAINRISRSLGKDLLEIIVIDDDSPDLTWKIVQDMKNPKYKVIKRVNERGLASAIATGVKKATGNIIVWMDCDLGIPPEDVPKLIEKLTDYDIAIGSRYVGIGKDLRSKFRAFLSYVLNLFASLVLGFDVRDYTSGFIALRREVLKEVKINPKGFGEYFVEFVYRTAKKGFRMIEVGYIYSNRKGGISKSSDDLFTLFRYGIQYGLKIIKLRFSVK